MTPQELREKRCVEIEGLLSRITGDYGYALGPLMHTLDNLEKLDREYTAAQSAPYYDFVNQAESLWALVKSCEGQPAALHSAIDALMSHLMHYAGTLPGKGEGAKTSAFKMGDKAIYGSVPVEITAVFKGDEYRIEWTNSDGEWMCVDTHVSHLAPLRGES